MAHDRMPKAQPITPHMIVLGDRYEAMSGQIIHGASVVKWTNLWIGSENKYQIRETSVDGEQAVGVSISYIPATGVREFVAYLNRAVSVCVHGPCKVMNGSTGAIKPSDEVTTAASATDGNGITWYGLIKRRINTTEFLLGYALDYFAPFDNPGDISEIFVTQGMIR